MTGLRGGANATARLIHCTRLRDYGAYALTSARGNEREDLPTPYEPACRTKRSIEISDFALIETPGQASPDPELRQKE